MGMFNDFRNTNRDNWKFTYLGKELLSFAREKYDDFTSKEMNARQEMASMLTDPKIRANDPKIEDLKKSIEFLGCEREKCIVWVHEFTRQSDREYSLGLGDVSYFDIAKLPQS